MEGTVIRDPETMTSPEMESMKAGVGARIITAVKDLERPTEHERARRKLDRLAVLRQEIDEWE